VTRTYVGSVLASPGQISMTILHPVASFLPGIALLGLFLPGRSMAQAVEWFAIEGSGPDDWLSLNVQRLGDVNGDGIPEFVLGDPLLPTIFSDPESGIVRVCSGVDGTELYSLPGVNSNDRFGAATSDIGDVNGDGIPDLAIGAPGENSSPGRVYVHSGANGDPLYSITGALGTDLLGTAVAGVGDLNADGIPDFVATSPNSIWPGHATAFSGADGAILFEVTGSGSSAGFGNAVIGIGDVSGDGVPDFLVAASSSYVSGPGSGEAFAFSGTDGALLYTVPGGAPEEFFGHALCRLGDVSGDGIEDFAVGAPLADSVGADSGYVRVVSGADGTEAYTVPGGGAGLHFGSALCGTQDLTGDGVPDLLVGAPEALGAQGNGSVSVHSGNDGSLVLVVQGKDPNRAFGNAMAGLGDVNGDGSPEFVVISRGGLNLGIPPRTHVFMTGCVTQTAADCLSLPNSTGQLGALTATGCGSSLMGGVVELSTIDLPAEVFGFFLMSQQAGSVPVGGGLLCLGAPVTRLTQAPGALVSSGVQGRFTARLNLADLPPTAQVVSGTTWRFQLLHRDVDASGVGGINLTSSVALIF
jgi:hypothetical protein